MSDTDMARLAGPPAPNGEHARYEQSDVLSLMHVFEPPMRRCCGGTGSPAVPTRSRSLAWPSCGTAPCPGQPGTPGRNLPSTR
jgi:hypothetical protein